jgi:hypothetical protein
MHGHACVSFSILPWRIPWLSARLQWEWLDSIASASEGRNIHAGRTGLNRRQFVFFLTRDIAVGIARQCNCYSGAASRGWRVGDSATYPLTVRRPFDRLATARKLLDGDWRQARAARFGACRQRTQSERAMHSSISSAIRALPRAILLKAGEAAHDKIPVAGCGRKP